MPVRLHLSQEAHRERFLRGSCGPYTNEKWFSYCREAYEHFAGHLNSNLFLSIDKGSEGSRLTLPDIFPKMYGRVRN